MPTGPEKNPQKKRVTNKLLLALPDSEYQFIGPELEFLKFPQGRTLYEANEEIEFVYFPNDGLISLVIAMEDSKTVEVGVVGNEGFAGVPCIFGLTRSPVVEMVQIAGDGFRMKAETLCQSLTSCPQLAATLGRYAILLGLQVSQTAACNRLHDIEQRLSRWLLMAQDRVHAGLVPITHEFLAIMLGTDRPTVSTAAANLQRQKIIHYTRGAVRVLNRKKLEASACECYRAIQGLDGETD